MRWVPSRVACQELGVDANTLRNWDKRGLIKTIRTKSNQRRYDLDSLLGKKAKPRKKICYCRVSSSKQKDDLERQKQFMQEKYPEHEIVTDIGSGLSFKRKGLLKVLEQSLRGNVQELLCTHRDRLSRFGFQLIQWILELSGGRVVVLEEDKSSGMQKLTEDLMSIIHVFSCRLHGMRRYSSNKKSQNQILPKQRTATSTA